jgi:hypothetical protein
VPGLKYFELPRYTQPDKDLRLSLHQLKLTLPAQPNPKVKWQISLTISGNLCNRIAKDAARINRTVEEHLKKHLTKRYDK